MSGEKDHTYLSRLRAQLADRQIDRREFLRTATLLGVSASAALTMAGQVRPARAEETPKAGGKIRIENKNSSADPATMTSIDESNATRQALEYLTETGADNITRPYLLDSWKPSDDLRSWTLNLRKGVKWQDGRDFTADDVTWNIKRLLTDETGSSVLGLMKGYMLNETKGADGNATHSLWDANAIEKVDDHTVRLNLKVAQIAVPEHLFHYSFAMVDPTSSPKFRVGINGTGPFRVAELNPGRNVIYEANKNYWGQKPYLDRLEFVDYGDERAAVPAALISGQIQGILNAEPQQMPLLRNQPTLQLYEVLTGDGPALRFRVDHKPFDNPKVRLALRLGVDNAAVAKLALGDMGSAGEDHMVAPVHPEYFKLPDFKQDVARAKQLLAEAGYPNGLQFEVAVTKTPAYHILVVQAIVEQWKQIGVNATINLMPTSAYYDVWTKVPVGLTSWAHRPLGIMNIGLAYRSGAPWNESGYNNPEFDKLLTQAESVADPVERRKVMEPIEKILQEDGPMIQATWRKQATFYAKAVGGFSMHPSQYIFARNLWLKA
ncbi:ABC transporter substrate-binding protein [Mesorhizobium sp. B2-3-4]|uniref:ABC transporter substrate-binding protein n=1 Tax=Mesorhizobium sp. B2-3-4 TaxID=2589959 RepID=UPI001128202B|nr:ABC transporter substrate-binding protein [Mesorhizobium sp. B2-3-4]TPM40544.1 ABC transporter substrate-binding protein [Mesorhizobium sp. B2-3-4]